MGFLLGQAMKATAGKIDPKIIQEMIQKSLS